MSRLDNFDSTDVSDRTRRAILKKSFIENVAVAVFKRIGRRLVRTELESLIRYLDSVDYNGLRGSREEVVTMLANGFAQKMGKRGGTSIDIHELLKSHIGGIEGDSESIIVRGDGGHARVMPENPSNGAESGILADRDIIPAGGDNFTVGSPKEIRRRHPKENFKVDPDAIDSEQSFYPTVPDASYMPQSDRAYLPPEVLYKHPMLANQRVQNIYLLLDSRYRVLDGDWSTFSWGVAVNGRTPQGSVGTLADYLHNIINLQFNKFYLPYVPSADNFYNKIALYIQEFSSMSTLLNGKGRRFHMLFDSVQQVGKFQLTPLENDLGKFRFPTPINELSNITIQFFSPFNPVVFLPDRYTVTIIAVDVFHTIINFSEQHNVVDGDVVYIDGFESPSGPSDIVDGLNGENGFVVTYLNATQLQIDYNLTTIIINPANTPTCFIGSRRLIIPLRMEYIPDPK